MSADLPEDWRTRVVDMVRGAAPLDGGLFRGSERVPPEAQIGIYREQFRLRLVDAVREEIPGLAHLLGPDTDALIEAFLASEPPSSWTLDRVALGLDAWLAARGAPAVQIDMARLDLAVSAAFTAADPVGLSLSDLAVDPVLVVQPPVRLLRLSHSVFRTRSAVRSGDAPPAPVPGDFPLVVFRPELKVRHLVVPDAAWHVLCAFERPSAVGAALDAAVAAGADTLDLATHLSEWFDLFARNRILGPVSEPAQPRHRRHELR